MTWLKLDDSFSHHDKTIIVGNEAAGAFCRMLSWCGRYETDGRLPGQVAHEIAKKSEVISALVGVNNPTAKQVRTNRERVRKLRSDSGQKGGSKRAAKGQQKGISVAEKRQQKGSPVPVPIYKEDHMREVANSLESATGRLLTSGEIVRLRALGPISKAESDYALTELKARGKQSASYALAVIENQRKAPKAAQTATEAVPPYMRQQEPESDHDCVLIEGVDFPIGGEPPTDRGKAKIVRQPR
jgi:hypothetical protein